WQRWDDWKGPNRFHSKFNGRAGALFPLAFHCYCKRLTYKKVSNGLIVLFRVLPLRPVAGVVDHVAAPVGEERSQVLASLEGDGAAVGPDHQDWGLQAPG